MPEEAKYLWAHVFNTSEDYWRELPDYHEDDARLTANAAVHGWWKRDRSGWHKRRLPGLRRLPDPGNLFNCGTFIDVTAVHPDGDFDVSEFGRGDKVPLWWSEDLKACLIMPYLQVSACIYEPTAREDRISKVWAKGRPGRCAQIVQGPQPPLPQQLPGLAIAYWSDKFASTRGDMTHYIHHFENDVYVYYARPLPGRTAPAAILVRGGKLRLTEHGLAG